MEFGVGDSGADRIVFQIRLFRYRFNLGEFSGVVDSVMLRLLSDYSILDSFSVQRGSNLILCDFNKAKKLSVGRNAIEKLFLFK